MRRSLLPKCRRSKCRRWPRSFTDMYNAAPRLPPASCADDGRARRPQTTPSRTWRFTLREAVPCLALSVEECSMAESTGFTRRHFLTVATAVTGVAGLTGAAVPFVASFRPSARAQALGAPVEVDVSKIEPGAMLRVEWRGRPIF